MARFRDHSNQIKSGWKLSVSYNEAIFKNIRAKKIIAQNLVKIRKCHLPKNKTTFFTYF